MGGGEEKLYIIQNMSNLISSGSTFVITKRRGNSLTNVDVVY